MKFSNRLIINLGFMCCLAGGAWFGFSKYNKSVVALEFYSLVDHSNQNVLDLRQMHSVDWDELIVWTPYANICDYGILEYEKGSVSCASSTDDGECYLLFLKNNRLSAKVEINRKKIDLASSGIKGRVAKEKAKFIYTSKGDWPKVLIQNLKLP